MTEGSAKIVPTKYPEWKPFVFPALFLVLLVGIGPLIYSLVISTFQYNLAKTTIPF